MNSFSFSVMTRFKRAMTVSSILFASTQTFAAEPSSTLRFADETTSSALTHSFTGEWEFMVGGGVASFDCNADGFDDLMIAGGTSASSFFVNTSTTGGALTFLKQTSGLELKDVAGAYPLDIDSDGIMDVIVLRVGDDIVMRGKGNCQFERANETWNFAAADDWSTAYSAQWEKGATWPTIAIGNYIDRKQEVSPWGSCTANWLYRPDGNGFAKPTELKPSYCPLSMLFSDWDRSGRRDLRVSNDREYYEGGQEQLWRMEKNPALFTDKEGWKYLRIWGMGLASADLNFDGYPEYFHTSMADNKLQALTAPKDQPLKPDYSDIAFKKGVTAHRPYQGTDLKSSTAWHTQFEDVNNDGLVDLFIAKGNVWDMPDFAKVDPNNMLVQKDDGTFEEAGGTSGISNNGQSRGAALADFNLDGRVDLLVVNRNGPTQLWRNTSDSNGHWLQLRLKQDGINRDAIGAWIEVKRGDKIMSREVSSGGGHVSGQNNWWHLGLGEMKDVEIRVIWPDGEVGAWQKLAVDGFFILQRGQVAAKWNTTH